VVGVFIVIGLTAVLNIEKKLALNKLIGKIRFYEFEPAAFRRKIKKNKEIRRKTGFLRS
jgi:hypothetical protein